MQAGAGAGDEGRSTQAPWEGTMTAADHWRQALAGWAIPSHILAAAPESPWGFPVSQFAWRADALMDLPTPSQGRAFEVLPEGGSVLDVGCGAGAASPA